MKRLTRVIALCICLSVTSAMAGDHHYLPTPIGVAPIVSYSSPVVYGAPVITVAPVVYAAPPVVYQPAYIVPPAAVTVSSWPTTVVVGDLGYTPLVPMVTTTAVYPVTTYYRSTHHGHGPFFRGFGRHHRHGEIEIEYKRRRGGYELEIDFD